MTAQTPHSSELVLTHYARSPQKCGTLGQCSCGSQVQRQLGQLATLVPSEEEGEEEGEDEEDTCHSK